MHPQANGQVERYVAVVKHAMIKLLSDKDRYFENWVELLPSCLMAVRFLTHRTLGYSPFTVIHGL